MLDDSGRLDGVRWVPSPNFDERPPHADISMLVLHCISLPPGEFGSGSIEALFCNRLDLTAHDYFAGLDGLRVSAHFLIDRAGHITQFVDCQQRAWHAGESSHCGVTACNNQSIGIELEGTETTPYEGRQYEALIDLVTALRSSFPALRQGPLVAHSDIAPGRKTDPGPAFDWTRLRSGLRARGAVAGRPVSTP